MTFRSVGRIAALVTFATAISFRQTPVQAQVLLSNMPGTGGTATFTILGNSSGNESLRNFKGVGMTLGAQPFVFSTIAGIFLNSSPVNRTISGGIYANNAGNPGTELLAFTPTVIGAGTINQNLVLSSAAAFTLNANTTYWFILTADVITGQGNVVWSIDNLNTTPTTLPGISFNGYSVSQDNQATYSNSNLHNQVQITAEAIAPEPGSAAFLAPIGLFLAMAFCKRQRNR